MMQVTVCKDGSVIVAQRRFGAWGIDVVSPDGATEAEGFTRNELRAKVAAAAERHGGVLWQATC